MENKNTSWVWLLLFMGLILFGWGYVQDMIWPPPPPKPAPELQESANRESITALAGTGLLAAEWVRDLPGETEVPTVKAPPKEIPPSVKPARPTTPPEFIALGPSGLDSEERLKEGWYLDILLNRRGAGVQQVILTAHQDCSRLGKPVFVDPEQKHKRALHLLPGVRTPHSKYIKDEKLPPHLEAGLFDTATLEEGYELYPPSFAMYHYRDPDEERPEGLLGAIDWDVVKNEQLDDGRYEITFRAELGAPHHVAIHKTFSLKPREYHVGMKVEIEALEDRSAEAKPFRYQLSGPFGLPIEGEWYTMIHRNALFGFRDPKGVGHRELVDPLQVRHTHGSRRFTRGENPIQYAAVAIQYFASAIVVDDDQKKTNFIEFARATYEEKHLEKHKPSHDLTVRTITEPLEISPDDKPIEHRYLLYNGPAKIRLLKQLESADGTPAVEEELVDRYMSNLNLDTITDYHSPNFFGRFANAIMWSDLIIAMTNLMHWILGGIYSWVPFMGVSILILTVFVRGMLHPLSRRQAISSGKMQEKMAKVKPEMDKIKAQFKGNVQAQQAATMELYRKHGINPFAMMGGCVLLLLQMPIFMGLYFALQESIFFRLQSFLWIDNLAAPDMLIWWTEHIPIISSPDSREGFLAFLWLGPFFNILPLLAVTLMIMQQKLLMPPPTDEQQEMQQKMMKYMMIMFAVFFYKIAAGLALYFIASTLWGLIERKLLLPKPKPKNDGEEPDPEPTPRSGSNQLSANKPKKVKPRKGGKGAAKGNAKVKHEESQGTIAKLRRWWDNVLEEAKKKQ